MTIPQCIRCVRCGTQFLQSRQIFQCDRCDGALDVVYDYNSIKKHIRKSEFMRKSPSHWKYGPFYPVDDISNVITMGEGATPLIQSRAKRGYLFKTEYVNPTCSFKDRGSSVELTKAKELGVKEVVCASTGNMGASIAAYSARAGIKCTIYLPTFAPKAKAAQIRATGANVVGVHGTYEHAVNRTLDLRKKRGVYLTGDYAYRGEGTKSVGFEILDQLNWDIPDYIVMPVGNAVLFSAVHKAALECKKVGLIKKLPKLVAVQAKGCRPIVDAFDGGHDLQVISDPETIATAISCGNPVDGIQALEALKKTKGSAVAVSDREILVAQKDLGKEGLWVEPSGAVGFAGAKKLGLNGTVVCVLTGHGLKTALDKF